MVLDTIFADFELKSIISILNFRLKFYRKL